MLFQKLSFNYNNLQNESMVNYWFDGELAKTQLVMKPNTSHLYSVSYSISKGLIDLDGKIDLGLSYNHSKSTVLIDYDKATDRMDYAEATEEIATNPVDWLYIEQSAKYGYGQSKFTNNADFYTSHKMVNKLKVGIKTKRNLVPEFEVYNYFGRQQSYTYNFWLANLAISYSWYAYRFQLRWNNIANTKFFESSYITALSRSQTKQQIRGTQLLFSVNIAIN